MTKSIAIGRRRRRIADILTADRRPTVRCRDVLDVCYTCPCTIRCCNRIPKKHLHLDRTIISNKVWLMQAFPSERSSLKDSSVRLMQPTAAYRQTCVAPFLLVNNETLT
jgi:hypothetical protein